MSAGSPQKTERFCDVAQNPLRYDEHDISNLDQQEINHTSSIYRFFIPIPATFKNTGFFETVLRRVLEFGE